MNIFNEVNSNYLISYINKTTKKVLHYKTSTTELKTKKKYF